MSGADGQVFMYVGRRLTVYLTVHKPGASDDSASKSTSFGWYIDRQQI